MAGYSAFLRNTIFKQHAAIRLAEDTFSFKSDRIGLQDTTTCVTDLLHIGMML
jgi:hypothetical protein